MELISKYRPTLFKNVIGQGDICNSIQSALKQGRGRTFLLAGPSGVGKTTIARIIAKKVGCTPINLHEVDGASNTGIDAMRGITSHFDYKSFDNSARVVIVDECHAISTQAWKSLLKSIEEPPEDVYWVLCTTEIGKVPKEVKTRSMTYELSPVARESLFQFLMTIAEKEKLPINKCAEGIDVLADLAQGSPRLGLSMLAKTGHLTDEEEIADLCSEQGGGASKEAIHLCRLLMNGKSTWKEVQECIRDIASPPESVRIVVLNYMAAVALKKPKPINELAIMEEFAEPFQDREGKAPILLACARLKL